MFRNILGKITLEIFLACSDVICSYIEPKTEVMLNHLINLRHSYRMMSWHCLPLLVLSVPRCIFKGHFWPVDISKLLYGAKWHLIIVF